MSMDLGTLLGGLVGFVLTLMVFSYLLSDNFLFRLAMHIFIGVAAGYVALIAVYNVIIPRLVNPLLYGNRNEALLALIPLAGAVLLLGKATRRLTGMGRLVLAFLVGVGAAAVVGGAVLGTLVPQVAATIDLFDAGLAVTSGTSSGMNLMQGVIILIGVTTTLAYFHFGVRSAPGSTARPVWLQALAGVGQVFIAIAFGAVFAGVYAAALGALIERLSALLDFIYLLMTPAG